MLFYCSWSCFNSWDKIVWKKLKLYVVWIHWLYSNKASFRSKKLLFQILCAAINKTLSLTRLSLFTSKINFLVSNYKNSSDYPVFSAGKVNETFDAEKSLSCSAENLFSANKRRIFFTAHLMHKFVPYSNFFSFHIHIYTKFYTYSIFN